MTLQFRRFWRVEGEDPDLIHGLVVDTASGEEREIKLRERRNPALFRFVRDHVEDIPTQEPTAPSPNPENGGVRGGGGGRRGGRKRESTD